MHSEPVLQPVGSLVPNRPVLPENSYNKQLYQSEITSSNRGCLHFTNNFYLTVSFGLTFVNLCTFLATLSLLLAYVAPICWCDNSWAHLSMLDINQKIIVFTLLGFIVLTVLLGIICLRGLLITEKKKVLPFLLALIVTEAAVLTTGLIFFIKAPKILNEVQQNAAQPEYIYQILENVFKKKIVDAVRVIDGIREAAIDEESIDYQAFAEHVFQEKFLIEASGFQNMLIFGSVAISTGLNSLILLNIWFLIKVLQRMTIYQKYLSSQNANTKATETEYMSFSPAHHYYSNNSTIPPNLHLSRQSSYRKRTSTNRQSKEDYLW